MKYLSWALCATVCLIQSSRTEAADPVVDPGVVRAVRVANPPKMDGSLDDPAWKKAPVYGDFTTLEDGSPAKKKTQIRCLYDDVNMYFAIDCQEDGAALEKAKTPGAEVRRDDSLVELYIQPNPVPEPLKKAQIRPEMFYYMLALNAAGVHYGQSGRFPPLPGAFDVKTKVGASSWQAEVTVPFASLGTQEPGELESWKIQARRNAYPNGQREKSTLFPAWEVANNIKTFAPLVFVKDASQKVAARNREPEKKPDQSLRSADLIQKMTGRHEMIALVPHVPLVDAQKVYPDFVPVGEDLGRPVVIKLARNEFEAASFVIWSPRKYEDVRLSVSSMAGESGSLPGSVLDLRWVKCWYQAGSEITEMCDYGLTPELLLKNPDMVQVDLSKERNIRSYTEVPKRADRPDDAKELLPLKVLPADFAQQVWITAKVPPGTTTGVYRGQIEVMAGSEKLGQIPVEMEVLDFDLKESPIDSGLYVASGWGPSATENSPIIARAEMHNLVDHGIRYVGLWEHAKDVPQVVRMMQKAGLKTDRVFFSNVGNPVPVQSVNDDPEGVYQRAKVWTNSLKGVEGVKDMYLYLVDEASGPTLASERPIADALHRAGAKTWVACTLSYFPDGGDFIDLAVVGGMPDKHLAEQVHKAGKQIYNYANPQCGLELPETYRRNYGLLLWQAGYDGAFDFAYNVGFDDPWNDFDHEVWKDHLMVYPTKAGIIDTIQWEGWREGVDDCRYLATLLYWKDKAESTGHSELAARIDEELDRMRTGGLEMLEDLDSVRDRMIVLINDCRAASGPVGN